MQFDIVLYNQVDSAELDEMWSFVQNKRNQRWLWLAINHDTGDILEIFWLILSEREKIKFLENLKQF